MMAFEKEFPSGSDGRGVHIHAQLDQLRPEAMGRRMRRDGMHVSM